MFCAKCGELLPDRTRRCPVCGASQKGGAKLNRQCDCGLNDPKPAQQKRERTHSTWEDPRSAARPQGEQTWAAAQKQAAGWVNRTFHAPTAPAAGKKGMGALLVDYFKNYANFTGRCSRRDFWLTYLMIFLITLALVLVDSSFLLGLWFLGTLVPTVSMAARRLRDARQSLWWLLALLAPSVGALLLVILLCLPSRT